ncbi:uncharacterized protein [Triticum aestivum]|uniref:uncharacterized protein n=1 Tax=Triticum aestivum TaxID=4565 RepID=UPI001D02D4C4|nr:uncharacterized protein LOC123042542 [Triticum aestivum]
MLTERYMIDNISSSQGFISAVEHKTREVVELCSHYILARWDGLPMDEHHVTPLILEHLHLPYQPYMYPPYENASWLVRDLMNVTKTAYARVVLSSGVTMALDGTEVLCYLVKNVGVPMEAILYDFQIEEMMETMSAHLKVKIYGLPLHLWTRRAIERVLQPHCIVENVSQANLSFCKLRSVNCTAWAVRTAVPFPWYILVHVSSKYDKGRNQSSGHKNTETFCIGVDRINIGTPHNKSLQRTHRRIPSFLQALKKGMVSHSYLNDVDIPADQMRILESSFLLTSCDEGKIITEDKLTRCLQQMQIECPGKAIVKQVGRFKYLVYFQGPITTTLFHTLSTDAAGIHLPFGAFLVQKWSTSAGAVSSSLSRKEQIRVIGLPTEFYTPAIIKDILSPHCMLQNSSHQVDDSPDVWFYDCAMWANENKNIPEVISIWTAPNGLTMEQSPVQDLQVPL